MYHDDIENLTDIFGYSGVGLTLSGVKNLVKELKKVGFDGISTGTLVAFLFDVIVLTGTYNLESACEDNDHDGAYIFRYGDNNVWMPYS